MGKILRLPPRIKVLEALGAIADGRVKILDGQRAIVNSSDYTRVYHVYFDEAKSLVYSDDNGTIFRGYVGYPIIAFLMLKGLLPFDEKIASALKGIEWRKLNEKYKKYSIVEQIVKSRAKSRGVMPWIIDRFVIQVFSELRRKTLRFDPSLKNKFT